MTSLLSLYPRAWRDRYEDEFVALLEARPPDTRDRIDIVRGAIDARLHPRADRGGSLEPRVPLPYNGPWTVHRTGQITLVGGILYLLSLVLAINGPIVSEGGTTYRDGGAGFPTFFVAIVMLLLGSWAAAATLPSTSRVARGGTVIGAVAGLIWAVAPWLLQFAAVLWLTMAILAVEAARTDRWRWSDAAFLVGGVAATIGTAALIVTGVRVPIDVVPMYARDFQFVVLLFLAPLWLATAHALLRPAIPIADPIVRSPAA